MFPPSYSRTLFQLTALKFNSVGMVDGGSTSQLGFISNLPSSTLLPSSLKVCFPMEPSVWTPAPT